MSDYQLFIRFPSRTTYTVIDVRKTFEGFESDLRTIARRTEKWSMDYVDNIFHDILKWAENKYLISVDITLLDKNSNPLRAAKYIIKSDGTANSSDRAGKNNWENIADTKLQVIVKNTASWNNLSSEKQRIFKEKNAFKISWGPSKIDSTYSHLKKSSAQLYASNNYELQKLNFE